MPNTYTWSDLVTWTKPFVQSIPTSSLDAVACDRVNRIMWRAAFWRWSMSDLTAISLYTGPQDWAISNSDVYRLYRGRITWLTTTNVADDKDVVEWLPPNLGIQGGLYDIRAMCAIGTTTIRLDRAFNGGDGNSFRIDGEYQKNPTKITATSSSTLFYDDYIDVAIEGLKWAYMVLAKDIRAAGGVTIDSRGQRQYSGQYGVFMNALEEMKQAEDTTGDPFRMPSDPLGAVGFNDPGLFGW